jgi:hypothetical protein
LKPYARWKDELSVQDGCVLRGCRVVIPVVGREQIMDEIHNGHPGVSRKKSIARGFTIIFLHTCTCSTNLCGQLLIKFKVHYSISFNYSTIQTYQYCVDIHVLATEVA